jgi:hypothetical protein
MKSISKTLLCLRVNELAKVEVNPISFFVIHLALECSLILTEHMDSLSLWVPHHPAYRVMLSLYCDYKCVTFTLIGYSRISS